MKLLPPLSRRTMLVGAAASLASIPALAQAPPRRHALIGQAAPSTSLPLLGGGRMTLPPANGGTTIVNFFGVWCSDSLADVDDVNRVHRQLARSRDLAIVSIHVRGLYGAYADLAAFFAAKRYQFPVALDPDSVAYRAWQLRWTPSYVIVDRAGVIRDYVTGLRGEGGIGVRGLLARANAVHRPTRRG
jgi:AhpC/TSA family